jgi:indole-3-glycerol phosphate synthase
MKEMPDILKRICTAKRGEIARLRASDEARLLDMIAMQTPPRGFRKAIESGRPLALIAELKRASPSAGIIREDFDPASIAREYEKGGASCLSVLTDEQFFQGSLEDLRQARGASSLPVLRKDFILDDIQVTEARAWGADSILLIVACLEEPQLALMLNKARALGMDVLVEVHTEKELKMALSVGADMIGINNRDLRTFEVSLETTQRLASMVPEDVVLVAESGIGNRADCEKMKRCGVDAVLVGEALMRSADIAAATRALLLTE